jgi:hypothetical protein
MEWQQKIAQEAVTHSFPLLAKTGKLRPTRMPRGVRDTFEQKSINRRRKVGSGASTPQSRRNARAQEAERRQLELQQRIPGGHSLGMQPEPGSRGASAGTKLKGSYEGTEHEERFLKERSALGAGRKAVTVEWYRMRSRIKQIREGKHAPLYPLSSVADIVALFDDNENMFIEPDELPFILKACDLRPSVMEMDRLIRDHGDEEGWIPNEALIAWAEAAIERKRRTGTQRLRESTALPQIADINRRRAERRRLRRRMRLLGRNAVAAKKLVAERKQSGQAYQSGQYIGAGSFGYRDERIRGGNQKSIRGSNAFNCGGSVRLPALGSNFGARAARAERPEDPPEFHPLGSVRSVRPMGVRRGCSSFRVSPVKRRPFCNFRKFERLRREDVEERVGACFFLPYFKFVSYLFPHRVSTCQQSKPWGTTHFSTFPFP